MKRYASVIAALLAVVIVFGTVALRSRFATKPMPLPPTPRGVVLILVAHWAFPDEQQGQRLPHVAAMLERGPACLIPTRSGAAIEDTLRYRCYLPERAHPLRVLERFPL
jgi:hypothetical protein